MKTKICLLLAILLVAALPVTAFAADEPLTLLPPESGGGEPVITVSDSLLGFATSDTDKGDTAASVAGFYPFEIRYDTFGGKPIIIKSYKVPAGYDPNLLVEAEFVDGDYNFTRKEILKNSSEAKTETKLVAQTVTFTTHDSDQSTILSNLLPLMQYDEGGYSGQLELDYASIQSRAGDKENYAYPIRKTVEYKNLDRNDYAYIDKKVDGLTLQDVEWVSLSGAQKGDVIVPSNFTAKATYAGTGYGSKATEYHNTAIYKGTVSRAVEGDAVVSIIYQGERAGIGSNDGSGIQIPWFTILCVIAVLVVIGGIVWWLRFRQSQPERN